VEIHINDLGYTLERAEDGMTGLNKALKNDYSLIILDLMLPKLDGFEVCKGIREEKKYLPILMLTSKSEELDKVLGLELGADDYLTKPFSIRELIARIKAIFRRMETHDAKNRDKITNGILQFGNLTIDLEKRKVILSGKPVEVTAKEFELLALFGRKPGIAFTRQ
jgi:DNA-binding response OmpR family regulator